MTGRYKKRLLRLESAHSLPPILLALHAACLATASAELVARVTPSVDAQVDGTHVGSSDASSSFRRLNVVAVWANTGSPKS